jgi:hypothetical protein
MLLMFTSGLKCWDPTLWNEICGAVSQNKPLLPLSFYIRCFVSDEKLTFTFINISSTSAHEYKCSPLRSVVHNYRTFTLFSFVVWYTTNVASHIFINKILLQQSLAYFLFYILFLVAFLWATVAETAWPTEIEIFTVLQIPVYIFPFFSSFLSFFFFLFVFLVFLRQGLTMEY